MKQVFLEECWKTDQLKSFNEILDSKPLNNITDVSNRKQRVQ